MSSAADGPRASRAPLGALRSMLPYALAHKGRIAAALVALFVASAATLAVPVAVRRMIDFGFSDANSGVIRVYFIGMLAVVAALALASGSRYYLVMTLGERVVADLRSDLFRHLTRLDARFYETAKTGELLSRLTSDTTQLKSAFGASASVALRNFFLFLGAIVMMVVTSFKLSLVALAAIPVIVLPLIASGRSVKGRSRRAQDALADASAYAGENLAAVRTMQACGAEPQIVERFRRAADGAYTTARDATRLRALVTAGAIFLVSCSVVAVLWLGAQDVLAGKMTSGVLSQFVLYAVL